MAKIVEKICLGKDSKTFLIELHGDLESLEIDKASIGKTSEIHIEQKEAKKSLDEEANKN